MCAWQNNIPQATDKLSKSQGDILGNNQELTTAFNLNHVNLNAVGEGKHAFLQMPQQAGDTATLAAEVAVYAKNDAVTTVTELFFRRPTNGAIIPMTATLAATPGWTYLPSGIILQWGSATMNGGVVMLDVTLPIAFPTAILSVTATPNALPAGDNLDIIMSITAINVTTIQANRKQKFGTACSFNYLAIGH